LSRGGSFTTDAGVPMHGEGFIRRQCKLYTDVASRCAKLLCEWVSHRRFGAPLIDPGMEPIPLGTGFAQSGPADVFGIVEAFSGEVADRKVREIELRDGPVRGQRLDLVTRDAAAKERQLVAERSPVLRREVAGVIPPFGPKVVMRTMIARKNIFVARRGQTKLLNRIRCKEQAPEACTDAKHDGQNAGDSPWAQLSLTSD
jgi:hypothetical protein